MKKRIVAVDFDDVLADSNTLIIELLNKEYGEVITKKDFRYFKISKNLTLEPEEINDLYHRFRQVYPILRPVEGAVDGVRKLQERFDLKVLTSRPEMARKRIEDWISEYCSGSFSEIIFANITHFKTAICREREIYALIDDCLINLVPPPDQTRMLVFGDWPYSRFENNLNSSDYFSRIERVSNWSEVLERLLGYRN